MIHDVYSIVNLVKLEEILPLLEALIGLGVNNNNDLFRIINPHAFEFCLTLCVHISFSFVVFPLGWRDPYFEVWGIDASSREDLFKDKAVWFVFPIEDFFLFLEEV